MLTSEQIVQIAADLVLGHPPRQHGSEAEELRTKLARELAEMAAKGKTPRSPRDWSTAPINEQIEEAQRRLAAPGPRYTTQQVLEHLRSLENR